MGIDTLLATMERRVDTPATPCTHTGVTAKPAPVKACTLVPPVTPQNGNTAREPETRRQKVIAMLEAAPDTQRAIYTDTGSDPHNVILTIAVRACRQTCEMLIPKAKYDPWKLLELIERHGQTLH